MVSAIGLVILILGLLGAALMLVLAIKSTQAYYVKCQRCGHTTKIPRQAGEYACQGCGTPLAKVTKNKASG
ncbi:DUF2614 family zinc ribbon-containing protein [Desulforamulus putei]|uniref:Zinc-ribbon containing domain-containing protein n=1 Tax=Desulforamulus putei DSM 12395 TaxID=1121429 RepID=A0A1M4YET4_9FIRM|nr:DUF2614 family zinc ribbon-containing protein [Desulforamulus putei]SHF04287.1 Zinc-ribbon containing domain-containing protein [Desulforamulus putei DSM 12395]